MNNQKDQSSFSSSPLKEGVDFYLNEDGLMVLTESYHLKRGYCCKSDCTHCPYELASKVDPNIPQELQSNWSEDSNTTEDEDKYIIDPNWEID